MHSRAQRHAPPAKTYGGALDVSHLGERHEPAQQCDGLAAAFRHWGLLWAHSLGDEAQQDQCITWHHVINDLDPITLLAERADMVRAFQFCDAAPCKSVIHADSPRSQTSNQSARPEPMAYFVKNVVQSQGFFGEVAGGLKDFPRATARKFHRKLSPNGARLIP